MFGYTTNLNPTTNLQLQLQLLPFITYLKLTQPFLFCSFSSSSSSFYSLKSTNTNTITTNPTRRQCLPLLANPYSMVYSKIISIVHPPIALKYQTQRVHENFTRIVTQRLAPQRTMIRKKQQRLRQNFQQNFQQNLGNIRQATHG